MLVREIRRLGVTYQGSEGHGSIPTRPGKCALDMTAFEESHCDRGSDWLARQPDSLVNLGQAFGVVWKREQQVESLVKQDL